MDEQRTDYDFEMEFKKSFNTWADQGSISEEQSKHLASMVHNLAQEERKRRWYRVLPKGLAASAVFISVLLTLLPDKKL